MQITTEKHVIKSAARLLVVRNLLFLILIAFHLIISLVLIPNLESYTFYTALTCGVLLIIAYIWHLFITFKASKNEYIRQAFQDEYFKMIKTKSGYYGFSAMVVMSILLILLELIFHFQTVSILVPSEIILFQAS